MANVTMIEQQAQEYLQATPRLQLVQLTVVFMILVFITFGMEAVAQIASTVGEEAIYSSSRCFSYVF